ncbi:MAG: hypothetical protein DMG97_13895 [Acidobacteria bacterium]|nr:MAG: hypothetical protein DMG98_09830 [Acidobacteriota bacterium]PYV71318.1 MAG: hypothetical protein DMG96_29060 [Acidobacteriota bacterium]PYV72278.1 MAG: hypothetical protein DMG97_13895 [Acidobacteriota bacterium]
MSPYTWVNPPLTNLILKQIVEGPSRGVGARRHSGRSLLLHSHTDRIEPAFIADIFPGNSFRNPLHALEATGGIEVAALFAGVEFEAALWALSQGF